MVTSPSDLLATTGLRYTEVEAAEGDVSELRGVSGETKA